MCRVFFVRTLDALVLFQPRAVAYFPCDQLRLVSIVCVHEACAKGNNGLTFFAMVVGSYFYVSCLERLSVVCPHFFSIMFPLFAERKRSYSLYMYNNIESPSPSGEEEFCCALAVLLFLCLSPHSVFCYVNSVSSFR